MMRAGAAAAFHRINAAAVAQSLRAQAATKKQRQLFGDATRTANMDLGSALTCETVYLQKVADPFQSSLFW
jgi:hypothetical protein